MLNKLQALFPLLGWFYFSLLGYILLFYIFPSKKRLISYAFYGVFGLIVAFLTFQNLKDEFSLWNISQKTVWMSSEEKVKNEAGSNYTAYYLHFRKQLHNKDTAYLVDADTKEYHYARMYLYPVSVLNISAIDPSKPGLYIFTRGVPKGLYGGIVYEGKTLIYIERTQ